jgi:hypothetical protein
MQIFPRIVPQILYSALFILLVGCTINPVVQKQAEERALCIKTCQQYLGICHQICDNSQQICSKKNQVTIAQRYSRYREQQRVQGIAIAREVTSYRDPLQCCKTTCECVVDYRMCIQSCSGKQPKQFLKSIHNF